MVDFVGDRKKKFMEHRAPPWQPGQSGNPKGRALGSRNRMSESFLEDLRATWEKHGAHTLETCATEDPTGFVKIVASLLPKHVDLSVGVDAVQFVTTFRHALDLLGNEPPSSRRRLAKVIEAEVIDDADPE
jgi:uncharacterized protein DUF5681